MAEERHENGMGAAWARHAMCESALMVTECHQHGDIPQVSAFRQLTTVNAGHTVLLTYLLK